MGNVIPVFSPEMKPAYPGHIKWSDSDRVYESIAERMGIKYQSYQRLEDPARTNPTLKTINKLEHIFNERLLTV